jgi:hypothetical protein
MLNIYNYRCTVGHRAVMASYFNEIDDFYCRKVSMHKHCTYRYTACRNLHSRKQLLLLTFLPKLQHHHSHLTFICTRLCVRSWDGEQGDAGKAFFGINAKRVGLNVQLRQL